MTTTRIEVVRGATFTMAAQYREAGVNAPIPSRYTEFTFVLREAADPELPALLQASIGDGFTVDHATGRMDIVIGATATDAVPVVETERIVVGQIRAINPADAEDVPPWRPFAVYLCPRT